MKCLAEAEFNSNTAAWITVGTFVYSKNIYIMDLDGLVRCIRFRTGDFFRAPYTIEDRWFSAWQL